MFKIFKQFKEKEWLFILFCIILIVVQVWLDLKLPDYMAKITTLVQTKDSQINAIWLSGGAMLLCALGSLLTSFVIGFFASQVAAGLSMRLRSMVFNKTLSFSMEEINHFSTSSLITRSTNDITQIQTFIAMGLQVIVKAPILAVWAIIKISGKNFEWTLATGVAVVFLLIMLSIIVIFAIPKFKIVQQLTDNLNRVTREHLTGLRVVKAYNAEKYQAAKFEKANQDVTSTNLFVSRIMALLFPSITLIMSGLTLSIYWIGAILINAAEATEKLRLFSDMVVFSAYAMQVIMAFMLLSMIFILYPRASVSAKRINEVLETTSKIIPGSYTGSDQTLKGEIEFKNVSFKYPDSSEYVLQNINFKAHAGETIAFIGSTGSGKSSLINLICRFYDVTEGEILVDGVNVKAYTKEALQDKLGYVSQRAVMFTGTINSNLTYGRNTTNSESAALTQKALNISQSSEFVEKMEGTYDAPISQGGTNLSGGQKQRLSIARAIYKQPEIYIFDDSFSALDYKTDRILRSKLKEDTAEATKLIVAQRIGTIKDADKIIVLDEGQIVGMGRHEELLKSCLIYQEIAYSQLSKEELENE
ncbi:ABC transporter ATP-binding protein [Cellulosilyticum sp. I15G10I2]|uniref:ABC transporter ATP-binding protein n=1 Tax=Cellulosilyticum sp. I15G10I2 TaxID=1892843 RepID=UPI00085CD1F8|nr:ABC transporter ATP-binding protein [Cellulosilyticum sp. I15G10I2]